MSQTRSRVVVLDVPELGQPALIVNTEGPRLLLLDEALDHEERMDYLQRFFPKVDAEDAD